MPADQQLQVTGGVTQALLAALDQIHQAITARMVGPDGKPSGTAVYMHLPVGQPIDPSMYSFPWTPAGGSSAPGASTDSRFAPAAPAAPPAPEGTTPAAALAATPPQPDAQLQHAIQSAFNTSQRVDNMLMVTKNGIASSWPDRKVSFAYQTALAGMQAEPAPPPTPEVQARIDAAKKTLFVFDAEGNMTGYTRKYEIYNHNRKAWEDAVSAYASAHAAAMTDPAQGQVWPVISAKFQGAVDRAWNDLHAMGAKEIEDAIATTQSIGGSAAATFIAQARKLFEGYSLGLSGAVAAKVPWSYIDPVSWWDHTNKSFGVNSVDATSSSFNSSAAGGSNQFSRSYYDNYASATSGGVGFSAGLLSIGANASHSDSSSTSGTHADSASRSNFSDVSSTATVKFEWFLASIERPWLLGDLFHMDGWYIVGKKKGCISDGTVDGQIPPAGSDKLLPMVPKGFIVVRNVKITADNWGNAGDAFQKAVSDSTDSTSAESTSYGGSVGYFGIGGKVQRSSSESHGVFEAKSSSDYGWSFHRDGQGGTLEILGGQIVGWVGEIQALAPKVDAPETAETDSGDAAGPDAEKKDAGGAAAPATPAAPAAAEGAVAPATPAAPAAPAPDGAAPAAPASPVPAPTTPPAPAAPLTGDPGVGGASSPTPNP
ncbi:hypothetical protein AB0E82_30875 [Streptomyces anulatus]|uniref:hypothetical protein n=1 Tax=Streptomyces anulatus TaxID=1892 RepID=UPI0033D0EBC5